MFRHMYIAHDIGSDSGSDAAGEDDAAGDDDDADEGPVIFDETPSPPPASKPGPKVRSPW